MGHKELTGALEIAGSAQPRCFIKKKNLPQYCVYLLKEDGNQKGSDYKNPNYGPQDLMK